MTLVNRTKWDTYSELWPNMHVLQTSAWGLFKQKYGWYPKYLLSDGAGAQILFRKFPFGLTFGYIPKGPSGKNWRKIIPEAISLCQQENAFVLYIEPDKWENEDENFSLMSKGFKPSPVSIQPRRTIVLSLIGSEEEWLSRMKQKTRYNIRLARKKEVVVEQSNNIEIFNDLIKITGARDKFGVHPARYYEDVFNLFSKNQNCVLLIAKYKKTPLAGVMVFTRGHRAWYFYGASTNLERNRMPAYLLQWEAMKLAASRGCTEYDLWGIPDEEQDVLEKNFMLRSDGLWGVYRFKRGFGGEIKRTAGVYQKVINKPLYKVYSMLMKIRQMRA
ncbi:MAG: peptidoglycan bridge formation glycyltransferase FemA/FemB family protein [Anaerolineaceae bacterium]|nr:peptidoglycan bridge formation glycyltransferase FemA/FemB family protein [Anaerolineaceae bacterium]